MVRPATPGDVGALCALENEARSGLEGVRGGDRWLADHPALADEWAGRIDNGEVLVSTIDGVVVGLLVWSVAHRLGIVEAVYVTPEARELGFGDELLEQAIANFRRAGATALDAEALPGDRETKNLYERAGVKARLITVSADI